MAVTLKTGCSVRGTEAIAERPDGSRLAFIPFPTPLFDDEGTLTGAVSMLVDISSRNTGGEDAQRLAAIVASSDDAIISKTLGGVITSWNEAAGRIFGYSADEIIGKSVLTLIPPDRHGEEHDIIARLRAGKRIEHYETVRQRKDGSLFDVSLTVSPLRRSDGVIIGASKIARDITERKHSEALLVKHAERLSTLNQVSRVISRDLDLERIVQAVTDIATDLAGAEFGAFFYNIVDAKGESYQLYTLSGAPRTAFETFGMPRATAIFKPTFDGTEIIRSADIRLDPRYGASAPHHGMPKGHLPVVSYLAVPVVSSSGEVVGGLFFGHHEAGRFDADAETLVSAVAAQAAVAMDNARLHRSAQTEIEQRTRAEAAKELLLGEIKHRVKNTLATVQAMASQTFRKAPPEERDAFVARLHALAAAHDLLTEQVRDTIQVASIVERALKPFLEHGHQRIIPAGPGIEIGSNKSLLLAMVLHELATNAVKYGALSNSTGIVKLTWTLDEPVKRLFLHWRETGGPPVLPPSSSGFGSRMIERALSGEGGKAVFTFAAEGLDVTLDIPV
jgi:PAS domain S-box-containing protein